MDVVPLSSGTGAGCAATSDVVQRSQGLGAGFLRSLSYLAVRRTTLLGMGLR
jgi:hypothetical protein